ncbi:MAG: hypothetical protein K6V36_08385 [Anaerolineae bacterium]|nr:hypothetical protein [Anaerolineae bacterium]
MPQTHAPSYPAAGSQVDLAPFACPRWWSPGEGRELKTCDISRSADGLLAPAQDPEAGLWQLGLEWEEARDVCRVSVRFAGPVPGDLEVQYWRRNWPTPAPERLPGARRGWIGRDDPFHGTWTTARGERTVLGDTFTLAFDPLDLPELGRDLLPQLVAAQHYRARFRRTLKVRVVSRSPMPPVAELHAYSPATWQEGQADLWFGIGAEGEEDWSGSAEAWSGYILAVEPLRFGVGDAVSTDGSWSCRAGAIPKGVRLRFLHAAHRPDAEDRTVITVRTRSRTFSFLVADLAGGPIYIPDYHVLVVPPGTAPDLAALRARTAAAPRPIYDRVAEEPEQSLARAQAEIPPLDETITEPFGRYLPLGVEAGRQELAIRYNGEVFADKRCLKLLGRDAARLQWPGEQLRLRFGTGDPPDLRERRGATKQSLLEGWLPVVISEWLDREIEYRQTAFACLLDGPLTPPNERRGDEDVVVMLRFSIRNATHGRKRARLWLVVAPQEEPVLRGNMLLAQGRVVPAEPVARQWRVDPYPEPCLRCAVHAGRGTLSVVPYAEEPGASHAVPSALTYDVDLDGFASDVLTLAVPFASLTQEAEWRRVAGLDYEEKLSDVVGYWHRYVDAGGQMHLPDAVLDDLHRAVRTHVAISVDKDPATGMIVVPAATWVYGACGNEACWQITMLDQAGHHDRAESYLETFLRTQGVKALDGNFSSAEGALNAMDLDAGAPLTGHFSYNLDHGYIMECLAAHYRYTGDRAWLERVAPRLVAACEFVIRERQATMVTGPDGAPGPVWGLLPAGHLEDNPEWRHWFAVNAHACGGMVAIAQVLAEIGHPEAPRLAREAASYREDIRRAARRAMEEAPVVRLLDGTYVPHVPTRTGLRGREWGWFREAAYGALHLVDGGVFEPHEPEVTWLLKDLEDNLFVSREWGRPVDLERFWFSQGGVTIQANLMDLALDYLRRGQPEHAIRALFNNFGQQLYPDVRAFTEHPVVELGHGVGPFYKTPDESKSLIWLRSCLLWEEGDTLHLAPAAPRAWFAPGQSWGLERMATWFGPITYRVEAEQSAVTVRVEAPTRRQPAGLVLHLRRPGRQPMRAATVNGKAVPFDAPKEQVRIPTPSGALDVRLEY